MNLPVPVIHQDVQVLSTGLPPLPALAVDWSYWIAGRPRILAEYPDFPKYLLLPEIRALLSVIDDDRHRLLFDTLWHTGARISEALQLRPVDFVLDDYGPYVVIPRAKRREGRPQRNTSVTRSIPLEDAEYIRQFQRYVTSHKIRRDHRLWPVTRQTADNWLKASLRKARDEGVELPDWSIGCHTFRHSFAINALLHYRPAGVLTRWMGHSDPNSTAVYTSIFLVDTNHFMRGVSF